MKLSNFKTLALAATVLASGAVHAKDLVVDPAHSDIGFSITHMKFSTVTGNFTDFNGTINLDEKDFTKTRVSFTVNVASVDTRNEKRNEHLRSPDFFDVKQFPEAKFVSTSIKAAGKDKYTMEGQLTLHSLKAKPVTFELVSLGTVTAMGAEHHMFKATTVLKRKDFGLTWNKALDGEGNGFVLGEEVPLTINVESAPPAPAAKK